MSRFNCGRNLFFSVVLLCATVVVSPITVAVFGFATTAGYMGDSFRRVVDDLKTLFTHALDSIKPSIDGIAQAQIVDDAYALTMKRLQVRSSIPVRHATMGVHFA